MDKNINKMHIYIQLLKTLHVNTYKREYINMENACNFFLLELEEMKSCIYCIKVAYFWVRL